MKESRVGEHGVGEVNQQLDGEKSTAKITFVVICTCGISPWLICNVNDFKRKRQQNYTFKF